MNGDGQDARRWMGEVTDVLGRLDRRDHGVPGSLWFTAAAAWELQDQEAAERLVPLIDRHRAEGGPPGPASLAHGRARLAALLGDRHHALELLGTARSDTAAAGARSLAALVDWDDAVVGNDREAATAALGSFERLGMRGWAARATAWLSGPAPGRPFGLTEREVEVLSRLAAGRTSQEIAGDLVISVATVNRHIANIYLKIDARNRAKATSFAFAQGIARR
jgi:DNA-binding CsgD family transcriptional regulator